jgi:hypothetical protein
VGAFYMLECLVPGDKTVMDLHEYPVIDGIESWLLGAAFSTPPIEPIRLKWNPETEGIKKSMYDATVPLLRKDLFAALLSLGVDNLDSYEVEIENRLNGEIDRDYLAFNVLGAIKAADLSKSKYADPSGMRRIDMDFESLVISPSAARDALLFRLGECVTGLVIHEAVVKGLTAKGGFGLTYCSPEDWIG